MKVWKQKIIEYFEIGTRDGKVHFPDPDEFRKQPEVAAAQLGNIEKAQEFIRAIPDTLPLPEESWPYFRNLCEEFGITEGIP